MGEPATLGEPVPLRMVPPLEAGDHLARFEFERRYAAMPENVWAELIEGVVYFSSAVGTVWHGTRTVRVSTWLGTYSAHTPETEGGVRTTVRLDVDNEPQPDGLLCISREAGGQSRTSEDGYVEGGPEFVAEVAASTVSIDLHDKLNAYRRNGVREYLVWRVQDGELDYFAWREGRYEPLAPDAAGVYRSEVFPGLWLDGPALLRGDMAQVLRVLQEGLASAGHGEFVERLGQSGAPAP